METSDIHFPKAGLDLSRGFADQRPRQISQDQYSRTTPVSVNVRTFEPGSDRARGGSRPGLVKAIAGVTVAAWLIQDLRSYSISGTTGVQTSQSGRIPFLVAVNQGNVYYARAGDTAWTAATNSTGNAPPMNFVGLVRSAPNNQLLFMVDGTGYCYFEPATTSVKIWPASSGQLPADSDNNYARLICTWRGRTVLSGLFKDDQNIFFSAVGEPTTWDYFPPVTTKTQAVALNAAPQGLVGDSVQCLIPYSDDVLIIGCSQSIFLMAGDPADGGELDRVTSTLGVAWGEPWCMGPDGVVYFVGHDAGVYVFKPGQMPQRISQPVEELLRAVNMGTTGIRLGYEIQDQCIHIFLSPLVEPEATYHLTLELRSQSWTRLKFKNPDHDPLCLCAFDGNTTAERVLVLGSWDGYVRNFDRAATTDDGTDIESEVLVGPITTKDLDEIMLHDLQAVLAKDSGDVDFDVLVSPTAELALGSTAVFSGTWTASDAELGGRNLSELVRRAGHAIYVRLSSSARWAMESIRASISTRGPIRRRGK